MVTVALAATPSQTLVAVLTPVLTPVLALVLVLAPVLAPVLALALDPILALVLSPALTPTLPPIPQSPPAFVVVALDLIEALQRAAITCKRPSALREDRARGGRRYTTT